MCALLQASLFMDADIQLHDWQPIFQEMKKQTVAALPGEWLKKHPVSHPWTSYCSLQQGQWIRVMYSQNQIIELLENNNIPFVIIKGAASAMYYPHPSLRSMGDVDILVKRGDFNRAAELLEKSGYLLIKEREYTSHHYNYCKDNIIFELHRRLAIIDDTNETLLTLFEKGVENRVWSETEGFRFPVLPPLLNGLVLIFHIDQHLRQGLGLRQIVDWMMYVHHLTPDEWNQLLLILEDVGLKRLALTVTILCQQYLGLRMTVRNDDSYPYDDLLLFILEKGNFGQKAGLEGKTAAFSLLSNKRGGFYHRLQKGGLKQWKLSKKHPVLQPFAWIYQSFRILRIFINNHTSLKQIIKQREKGLEQIKLIEALGLSLDRTIKSVECQRKSCD